MRLLAIVLLSQLACAAAVALPRVYLAPLHAPAVDPATTDLLADQVLVSARRHSDKFEVVGAADVKSRLDLEAARAALGCDTDSCANEIADALDADQLLAGQLGHIGEVWLLTLTRTDRRTMKVLSRASVEARGQSPEVLLALVPRVVDDALGVELPPNLWAWGGGVIAGVGAVPLTVGAVLYGLSHWQLGAAQGFLDANQPDVLKARQADANSRDFYTGALIASISGGALVAIGGTTALLALATEP